MNIKEAIAHCEMLLNYGILSSEDEEPMKVVLAELEKKQEEKLNIKKNTPEWEYQYWEARKEVNNEWKSKIKEKIEEIKRI